MIQSIPLKRLRPGNVIVKDTPVNMDSVRQYPSAKGPLVNARHSVSVVATRYFTDVNGAVLSKADAGLVAADMVHEYPVFLLGQFDKEGGYKVGHNILPPVGAAKYMQTFVNGYPLTTQQICSPYSPFNTIQRRIKQGDIVQVYADDPNAPTYFCFIVLSNPRQAYSSILANLSTKQNDNRLMKLYCHEVQFKADFQLQLQNAWHYVTVDNLGTFDDNQITYNQFNNPMNVLPDVLTIATEFTFNQYIGIYMYMSSDVDTMSFNFNLKMIE